MSNLIQISADEREQYRYIPRQKKIDAMEMYLLGRNGRFYNMEEVGEIYFGNGNESFTVSLIHRANGINCGRGSSKKGLYRPGCKFEQVYGYRVTRRDIEDFIRQYESTGSAYQGVSFEDWLISRAMQARQSQGQSEQYVSQTSDWIMPQSSSPRQELQQREPQIGENVAMVLGIASLIGIILIIIFRKQIWAFLVKVFMVIMSIFLAAIVITIVVSVIIGFKKRIDIRENKE